MSKKGATQSGSSKGHEKTKNQERAKHLPPSPNTWRVRAYEWPYHNNLGTKHKPQK